MVEDLENWDQAGLACVLINNLRLLLLKTLPNYWVVYLFGRNDKDLVHRDLQSRHVSYQIVGLDQSIEVVR